MIRDRQHGQPRSRHSADLRSVVLRPLTRDERRAFVDEQVADYAEYLVERGAAPDLETALAGARAEIEPEVEAAVQAGDEFWTAHSEDGTSVGWLWVKRTQPGLSPDAAFLYQIQVNRQLRRRGYGRAMLDALERTLAASGHRELHLNVWDTNDAGRRLYERAGYELVEQLTGKRHLRKRLVPASPSPGG